MAFHCLQGFGRQITVSDRSETFSTQPAIHRELTFANLDDFSRFQTPQSFSSRPSTSERGSLSLPGVSRRLPKPLALPGVFSRQRSRLFSGAHN